MSEKKELNQEQLEKVTGGGWAEEKSQYLPAGYGAHIGAGDAKNHTGKDIYVVDDRNPRAYCWGVLTSSDGEYHYVTAKGKSDFPYDCTHPTSTVENGKNYCFWASGHTLFLK